MAQRPLLHAQLALDAEFFNALAQRGAGDTQQLRGVDLVVVRFLQRLDDEFALDGGNHLQFRIAPGPLKQLPRERGGKPQWAKGTFPTADRAGRLVTLASGHPEDTGALPIRADARVLGATLRAGDSVAYVLEQGRFAYLAPARGTVTVNRQRVGTGDGVAIAAESVLEISAEEETEIVLVDAGAAPRI